MTFKKVLLLFNSNFHTTKGRDDIVPKLLYYSLSVPDKLSTKQDVFSWLTLTDCAIFDPYYNAFHMLLVSH